MNERALQIADRLLRNPDISVQMLEEELHLTRRQINYAIGQINDALRQAQLTAIHRQGNGTFLLPEGFTQLIAQEHEHQDESFIMDTIDRQTVLTFYLILAPEYISLQHLISLLDVTKNTVLNDIKQANDYAREHYHVSIVYSRAKGYYLDGGEREIRLLLIKLLQRHSLPLNQMFTTAWCLPIEDMIHFIHQLEQRLQVNYSDTSFELLVKSFSAIVGRINSGHYHHCTFFHHEVDQTIDYQIVKQLVREEWQLAPDDVEWFTLECLAANTVVNNATLRLGGGISDIDLKQIVHQMVIQFQNKTLIHIPAESKFERRLINHLRPACFRICFGFDLTMNTAAILPSSTVDHKLLKNLISELLCPLEQQLQASFPESEIELLTYYFGSQLMTTNQALLQKKAVVVCNNGLVNSHILREKMTQLFPELHILAAISVRHFYHFSSDFDLVFTTVPLNTEVSQYVVSPIISHEQQINLRYRVLKEENLRDDDKRIHHLMTLIARYATIQDPEPLREALQHYFAIESQSPVPTSEDNDLPGLSDYLQPAFIQIIKQTMTWSNAVCTACQPLLNAGIITEEYVDKLVEQTATDQDYSFLSESFSIPHALFTQHGEQEGIALAIFPHGVRHPNGQCIHFIAPIAIYNLTQHFRGINELATLSEDTALLQQLLQAKTAEEIYPLLFEEKR